MLIDTLSILIISIPIARLISLTPLNLGVWILISSLIFALFIIVSISSWFSFIIFLIYIGGILVIFVYFIALSPNLQLRLFPIITLSLIVFLILNILNLSLKIFPQFYSFFRQKFSFDILFLSLNNFILLTLAVILFLALISVVKISNRSSGPLRPFNNYVCLLTKVSPFN